MKRLVILLAVCTAPPLYAQGAQPDGANLKTEARNAVRTIGADGHKKQTYCQILELERQQQAAQEKHSNKKKKDKDQEKAEALVHKINQLQKQLGPESATIDQV